MYYKTWCMLEGLREFKTYDKMRVHWDDIRNDPHARYYTMTDHNGGKRVHLEKVNHE